MDWRKEQNFEMTEKEWFVFELTQAQSLAIADFAKDLGINWGRLDFMTSADDLVFLEFNANGQWVFLDYSGEVGLVKTVAKYLLPNK